MKFTAALSLTMALAAASEQYYGHDSHHDSHRGHGDSYGHDSYSAPSGYVPADTTYAKCMIKDPEEEAYVGGAIYLSQEPYGKTNIWGSIWGLSPGKHGFHVHMQGDLTNQCKVTGVIPWLLEQMVYQIAIRVMNARLEMWTFFLHTLEVNKCLDDI